MNKRLTEKERVAAEARYKQLRTAAMDAGKISGIVDKVSADSPDIKAAVESIMRAMDAEPEAAKYHTAARKARLTRLARILKAAVDMSEMDENPEEEARDFQDPALHMAEDLEHEVQTMDDHRLIQEVQQLEQHMKEDLNKLPGQQPHETHEQAPALSAEARLALLMSLPESKRVAKIAQLRALANVLESDMREVSQNNQIDEQSGSPELAHDYDKEEMGSMKDIKAASLKKTVKSIIASFEDAEKESAEDKKEEESEDKKVEAAVKLAMRHLLASLEEMEMHEGPDSGGDGDVHHHEHLHFHDHKGEDAGEEDKAESEPVAPVEDKKPSFPPAKEEEKDEEPQHDEAPAAEEKDEEAGEPTMEEKKAILRSRLAALKRTATVDGKDMKTPKEVPSSSGTTEDNLKGDAKVQYSTNNAGTSLDEIQTTRQKIKDDARIAGNDEPNAVYQSNKPSSPTEGATSETDSSKDVNSKRVLKDEGTAVQKSTPAAGADAMEMGSGSHQKEKDWDKAKSESETTPSGDRLVGLANFNEIVKLRTARAAKLASHMANLGFISTEAQLTEKIAELAALDDESFNLVASFTPKSAPSSVQSRYASEDAEEMHDEDEDDKHHEEENEEDAIEKEAGLVRRASKNAKSASRMSDVVNKKANRGLRTPLLSGTDDVVSHKTSTIGHNRTGLTEKLAGLGWNSPETKAAELESRGLLDTKFNGENFFGS